MYEPDPEEEKATLGLKPITDIDKAVPLYDKMPDAEKMAWYNSTRKLDANDIAAANTPEDFFKLAIEQIAKAPVIYRSSSEIVSLKDLRIQYPELREPVIDGLLRRGEIMNIIAAPKEGKSFLVTDLAFAVIQGAKWLGRFPTRCSRILVIDNELHKETIPFRTQLVAEKSGTGIELDYVDEMIDYMPLRGKLVDLHALTHQIDYIRPREYGLIILDAFYRFMPPKTDENDNGQIAELYNRLDNYASRTDSAICLIHHTSKGTQAGKKVTDVGAGAGAMTRATDTHLILRPHEEKNAIRIDVAVRSFPGPDPFCVRRKFPTWEIDNTLDPEKLEGVSERQANAQAREQRGAEKERLLAAITKPMTINQMVGLATDLRIGLGYGAIAGTLKKDWEPNKRLRVVRPQSGKTPALYVNSSIPAENDQKPAEKSVTESTQTPPEGDRPISQVEENPFPDNVDDI